MVPSGLSSADRSRKLDPELLILFGRGENSIYHTDIELREFEPELNRALIIGDIRDNAKVSQITRKYRPHIIFHAAGAQTCQVHGEPSRRSR